MASAASFRFSIYGSHQTCVGKFNFHFPTIIFGRNKFLEQNVEQIGQRICFNSSQCQSGAKVQGSTLIHTCRAGARSCQLASNLCIQRHLNAVAVGGEEQEEPAQMVHCQSGSQSVTHYVPHSVSLYCWQFWRTFIFHRTKVSLSCKRDRKRGREYDVMGAKSQRDTRHFMRLWGIV